MWPFPVITFVLSFWLTKPYQLDPTCFSQAGITLQSTLGLETLDKAAALGLETATPLTDPRQYINSNFGFRNLKFDFYIVK